MDTDEALGAYEWTVRALYAALIAGNLILLYEGWKDTPSGVETRARLAAWWGRAKNCEGCARRREYAKAVGRMLWQATEIVETADAEGESS